MERVLPNLQQKLIIDGAGHWVQQERPDEVNAALIAFLKMQLTAVSRARARSAFRCGPRGSIGA